MPIFVIMWLDHFNVSRPMFTIPHNQFWPQLCGPDDIDEECVCVCVCVHVFLLVVAQKLHLMFPQWVDGPACGGHL